VIKREDIDRFAKGVGEQIGHYVYVISSLGRAIYIGRGQRDRIFSHLKAARSNETDTGTDKLTAIRQAWDKHGGVDVYIAAQHLTESDAQAYEALLIAYSACLLKDSEQTALANVVAGTGGGELMIPLPDVNEALQARPVNSDFDDYKLLLISFNSRYDPACRDHYKRGLHPHFDRCWIVKADRAREADRIVLVARSLIRSVIIPDREDWQDCSRANGSVGKRFTGRVDDDLSHWIGKRLPDGVTFGAGQPVRYLRC